MVERAARKKKPPTAPRFVQIATGEVASYYEDGINSALSLLSGVTRTVTTLFALDELGRVYRLVPLKDGGEGWSTITTRIADESEILPTFSLVERMKKKEEEDKKSGGKK